MHDVVTPAETTTLQERDILEEIFQLVLSDKPFTDIMIAERQPVMLKLPGGWTELADFVPPEREDMVDFLKKLDADWETTITDRPINRPLELSSWRLRINAYLAFNGDRIVAQIRRQPRQAPELHRIGLPRQVFLMTECTRGLILVSGPTSSGKSTTMAAMVERINSERNAHIVTIEDPIEYVFEPKRSVFSQREVGVDTKTFYDGVREAMRQSPNVVVVGEIRDRETADTALLAGESGHLVIGTVHANSAATTVQKILGFFSSTERESRAQSLATSLVGIISQSLLPRADLSGWTLASEIVLNNAQQHGEVIADAAKLKAAVERPSPDNSIVTMGDSLFDLLKSGQISKQEAVRASSFVTPAARDRLRNFK